MSDPEGIVGDVLQVKLRKGQQEPKITQQHWAKS